MKDIPVHQIKDRGLPAGVEIRRLGTWGDKKAEKWLENEEDHHYLGAHRDDHYLFFLLEEGSATMMVDFHEFMFSAGSLYYILPGQVHHGINNQVASGWFIAVDSVLISPDYRNVFENQLLLQQPVIITAHQQKQCSGLLGLLHEKFEEDIEAPFYQPVIHSLLKSFVGIMAGHYSCAHHTGFQHSRPVQLSQQFKQLLSENIRTIKSPSAYAAKLNVSESYLNEALKKATGFSVTYWITQEVVLEAKRLLYYSEQNVKQIAHILGYEDHTYFSRLFKKTANKTPLEFRTQHRK